MTAHFIKHFCVIFYTFVVKYVPIVEPVLDVCNWIHSHSYKLNKNHYRDNSTRISNGMKMKIGMATLQIPCGSKISSKSLYLARFSRYKHFCDLQFWQKIRKFKMAAIFGETNFF